MHSKDNGIPLVHLTSHEWIKNHPDLYKKMIKEDGPRSAGKCTLCGVEGDFCDDLIIRAMKSYPDKAPAFACENCMRKQIEKQSVMHIDKEAVDYMWEMFQKDTKEAQENVINNYVFMVLTTRIIFDGIPQDHPFIILVTEKAVEIIQELETKTQTREKDLALQTIRFLMSVGQYLTVLESLNATAPSFFKDAQHPFLDNPMFNTENKESDK